MYYFVMTEIWIGQQNCNFYSFFLIKVFWKHLCATCKHEPELSISSSELGDNNNFYDIYFY